MLGRLSRTSTMTASLFLILAASSLALVHSASISGRDSYENLPIDSHTDDVFENIIDHGEQDDIKGLLPPLEVAKDFFQRDNKYAIEKDNKAIRLKDDAEDNTWKLSQQEEDALKQMSAAFAMVLADGLKNTTDDSLPDSDNSSFWDNVNPVITISDKGIAVELDDTEEKSAPEGDKQTSFVDLMSTVWDVVRASLDYATHAWDSFVSKDDKNTAVTEGSGTEIPTSTVASPSTSGSLIFAVEEPRARPNLPAYEFDGRGRDIDSILYGRGIA